MGINNTLLPLEEWKRLTVINCQFNKNIIAHLPFVQPFHFNVYDGSHSLFDISDMILDSVKSFFKESDFAVQETIMFEGQLEDFITELYPIRTALAFQLDLYEDIDDYVNIGGHQICLKIRLPKDSKHSAFPRMFFVKYHLYEEHEILTQLKTISWI